MLFNFLKIKGMVLVMCCAGVILFIFSYFALGESAVYSLALALIPIPTFCTYDKICMICSRKSTDRYDGISIKVIMSSIAEMIIAGFCSFEFSGGSILWVVIGSIGYIAINIILLFIIKKVIAQN